MSQELTEAEKMRQEICADIGRAIEKIRADRWANERGKRNVLTGMELALIVAEGRS